MSASSNHNPINILIVGTGLYVCGRGTDHYGTILPAVYEWKRQGGVGSVSLAGAHPEGIKDVKKKVEELNDWFGFELTPSYFPHHGNHDPEAYKDAIREIPKPACAVIVTPDHLHRKIAGDAIEHGMHTLVVKPLAPTVGEVLELVSLQEKQRVHCVVEFHKRYDRSNLKLRDTIAMGKIGDPLCFIVEYSQRKSVPTINFKSWAETTNIFQYLGVHYIDIIHFATQARPLRVMAIGQKNYLSSRGIETFDSIEAVIEWEMPAGTRFTSLFLTHWIDPEHTSAMSDQRIKVIGTKGRYEADQKRRGIYLATDDEGIEEPNPDFCSMIGSQKGDVSYQGYGIESVIQFFEDVESLEAGTKELDDVAGKRPTFRDSVIPTTIVEAVNRSLAENGRWIHIHFPDKMHPEFS